MDNWYELVLRAHSDPADLLVDPAFALYSLSSPREWRVFRARAQIALLGPLWRAALPQLSRAQLERSLRALQPILRARIDHAYSRESDRFYSRRALDYLFFPPYDERVLRDRAVTAILHAAGHLSSRGDVPSHLEGYASCLEAICREFVGACLESDSRISESPQTSAMRSPASSPLLHGNATRRDDAE